jgi:hypothetical protein
MAGWLLMQICYGQVTTVHLHQGAFVDIGCVHEGYALLVLYNSELHVRCT